MRLVVLAVMSFVLSGCLLFVDDDRRWPCKSDGDCKDRERCLSDDGASYGKRFCQAWPCDEDEDCASGERCDPDPSSRIDANQCVDATLCTDYRDCREGEACVAGKCGGVYCDSLSPEGACGAYTCAVELEACRETCSSDADCTGVLSCANKACLDLTCDERTADKCGDYACNLEVGRCNTACDGRWDCQGDALCRSSTCVQRECNQIDDARCNGFACNVEEGSEEEGTCLTQCSRAEDCVGGSLCSGGACVSPNTPGVVACDSAAQCKDGLGCDADTGVCHTECVQTSDCDAASGLRCAKNNTCSLKTSIVATVQAGGNASCHLSTKGKARCWGFSDPMLPDERYRAITIDNRACAQRMDGTVLCQSRDSGNYYDFNLTGLPDFEDMDTYGHYSCGLAEGDVTCFDEEGKTEVVIRDAMRIAAAGVPGVCAILKDQTIECVGDAPEPVPEGKFTELSCDNGHCCALSSAGTLKCWGSAEWQENDVPTLPAAVKMPISLSDNNCAWLSDGSVQCWGSPWGLDDFNRTDLPEVVEVTGRAWYLCARSAADVVYCWKDTSFGYAVPSELKPGETFDGM